MAAIFAIVRALSQAVKRDLGTFFSIRLNNLFLFAALLAYTSIASGLKPIASIPYFLLLFVVILFPLSADPLSKIPPSRMILWPLTPKQVFLLRASSLGLSPVLWIGLVILLLTRGVALTLIFVLIALMAQIVATAGIRLVRLHPGFHPFKVIPALPGKLGVIVLNNIRQIISLLDFYAALFFSIGAVVYRYASGHPDNAAYPIIAMFVALALSTHTQCIFGLDSRSGLLRYRLLPLRGWHILLCKDIAFLAVVFVLMLPTGLGLLAGLTFTLVVIAVGRYPSLALPSPQNRWRFSSGRLQFSVIQFLLAPALALAASRTSLWFLGLASVLYLISLIWGGWYWDSGQR